MAQTAAQLCQPGVVSGITSARESIDQHLKNILDEISQLQKSENFLDNVQEVQTRSKDFETWKVQREQLSAVEACAKTCTCDDGSVAVVQEYNTLARQAGEGSGLVAVPLSSVSQTWIIVLATLVLAAAIFGFIRRALRPR